MGFLYFKLILNLLCFIDNFDKIYGFNIFTNNKIHKIHKIHKSNTIKDRYSLMQINNQDNSINKYINNNIYFTGHLNDETCFHLSEILLKLEYQAMTNEHFPNHINLYIQSNGGSVMSTLAVVDQINNLHIPVNTIVRGYAASAATLLTIIGNERYIYKNSFMMIHGLKFNDVTVSNLLDVKDLNFNVNLIMSKLRKLYLNNSEIDSYILDEMFEHDIWMDAETALKYKLVDKII
tara:strand:- start:544 stop:1248 length:705 start_codon:yes stop_codon:yes gene_type:complete